MPWPKFNFVTHFWAYVKGYYLGVLNGQDPLIKNRWQTWRPPQDPGQSLGLLHSLSLVLATTFGCPNGQQHANLSSFLIISLTAAVSPRLHSSSSVRNAPWLAQTNLSISDSISRTHTAGRGALATSWKCWKAIGDRKSAVGFVCEVWKPKLNKFFYNETQCWFCPRGGGSV